MKIPSKRNSRGWWFHRIMAVSFCAVIWLPLIGMFVDLDPSQAVNENRQLANFPGVDGAPKTRAQLRAFFTDNVGLRNSMLRLHAQVKSAMLKTSNNRVVIGEDGWYFCDYDRAINASTGRIKLRPAHVKRWKTVLSQRADYLEKKGIQYGFLVVPDKHYIHGNALPEYLRKQHGPPVLEQFVNKIDLPNVHIIDIRDELTVAAQEHDTFYKGDTHWNGHGKAAGYQGILKRLREVLGPLDSLQPHTVSVTEGSKNGPGGLYRALAIDDIKADRSSGCRIRGAKAKKVEVPQGYYSLERAYSKDKQKLCVYENPDCDGPRLVMFHTSFTIGSMRNLLAEHFSRVVFVRHAGNHRLAFHKKIVEEENPDIVLNEIPSRYLTMNPLIAYNKSDWSESVQVATKPARQRQARR